jgi:lipopolysaccharide export LptBFGC system permease protein LptF
MKTGIFALGLAIALSTPAAAQLKPYQDYTVSDSVSNVSTIKVKENMVPDYLQGIRETWVASNEVEKRLGHMQSYSVYVSDLPNSGEFNVILVARFANTSDLAPNKARYEAFMRAWGNQNEAATRTTTTTVYPNLREITGEYLMREVTFLPVKK